MIDNLSDACKVFVVMVSKIRKFILLLIGLLITTGRFIFIYGQKYNAAPLH